MQTYLSHSSFSHSLGLLNDGRTEPAVPARADVCLQQRVGEQRQRDVPVPGLVPAGLVMVESYPVLRPGQGFVDPPGRLRGTGQFGEGGRHRSRGQVLLLGVAWARGPGEQPVRGQPARIAAKQHPRPQRSPGPDPMPPRVRYRAEHVVGGTPDEPAPPLVRHGCGRPDLDDVRNVVCLEPFMERRPGAAQFRGGDPRHREFRVDSPGKHARRQRGPAGERHFRYSGAGPPLIVMAPFLGYVQLSVDQDRPA